MACHSKNLLITYFWFHCLCFCSLSFSTFSKLEGNARPLSLYVVKGGVNNSLPCFPLWDVLQSHRFYGVAMFRKYFAFVFLVLFPSLLFAATDMVSSEKCIYTFGDYQLREGRWGIKMGPLAADEIPDGFPLSFLEPDGSYPGGRVYATIAQAKQAIVEAQKNGVIPEEGVWGVYLLEGSWDDFTYERCPNQFHLSKSTPIIKRVLYSTLCCDRGGTD